MRLVDDPVHQDTVRSATVRLESNDVRPNLLSPTLGPWPVHPAVEPRLPPANSSLRRLGPNPARRLGFVGCPIRPMLTS
jgi:hypothetical protein